MNTRLPPEPKKIELTFQVRNEAQARELDAAWREIITGEKLERTEALEHSTDAVMERARTALETIETAIRRNPGTGQAGRLVRFLASMYNGYDYAFDFFDLTELRGLDIKLANACLDYLNYDRMSKREVHHHLSGGDQELQRWIRQYRVDPRVTLNADDEHAARLRALASKGLHPNDLVREGLNLVLEKHEAREFGCLVSQDEEKARRAGGERPVIHARRLSDKGFVSPVCGALGAPWKESGFRFQSLTCERCKDLVLHEET